MNRVTTFSHAGSIGDVHASMAAIKSHCEQTNKKAILYLQKDVLAWYYDGAVHPTKNKDGQQVMLNEDMINMLIPLYKEQPYIEDVRVYTDEKIDVDLNKIRETFVGMPNFDLRRWYFYVFPDLNWDLSKDYMTIPDTDVDFAKGKILINRTERYTNRNIDFSFLKDYEDDCLFIGTMREYNNFCINFDLNIRKLNVKNFLEFGQAIKQSKFYIGNQSQGFQIAEAIHHPRILELCEFAPNVIISGANGYDYFAQDSLEYYFHYLNGTKSLFFQKLKSRLQEAANNTANPDQALNALTT